MKDESKEIETRLNIFVISRNLIYIKYINT